MMSVSIWEMIHAKIRISFSLKRYSKAAKVRGSHFEVG